VVDGARHLRAHPPPRVGREADAAVGVEALGRAQQADVALLHEVFFVHERAGELARLAVGDAAAGHRELPAQALGLLPRGLGVPGAQLELGVSLPSFHNTSTADSRRSTAPARVRSVRSGRRRSTVSACVWPITA
jgi:hypothetical protein